MAVSMESIIRDPNRKNEIFYLWDLFNASEDAKYKEGRYVPIVNDTVIDFENNNKKYYVSAVDSTYPYAFTLADLVEAPSGDDQDVNLLRGYGPNVASEAKVVYVDKTVTPNTLTIGGNPVIYSSSAHHIVVFKQNNISSGLDAVSGYYDENGNMTTTNIPLELCATDVVDNITIKAPKPAYATVPLFHGELVYVVVYNDQSKTLVIYPYIVSESSTINEPVFNNKYITGIELTSPFLSETEAKVIECKIDLPIDDLNLRGKISYSDGSSRMVDIDGNKAVVYGLGTYVGTSVGRESTAIFVYNLSDDEFSNNLANGFTKAITERYVLRTIESASTYSVKLFVIPRWVNETYGYRLEYYMYDLTRASYSNVTNLVTYNESSQEYDPLSYGVKQRLSVRLALRDVSTAYADNYAHVQLFEVTLMRKGDAAGYSTPYIVYYTIGSEGIGRDCYARRTVESGGYYYDISATAASKGEWIERLYTASEPLYSPISEGSPLNPTHVRVNYNGASILISVDEWANKIKLGDDSTSSVGGTILLEWVRKSNDITLELALSSLVVETQ